ncbi:MAG: hypothetical protein U0637_00210 [Phycisphaerales bacterium]
MSRVHRAAFTLIEVALATVIGSIVLIAALSLVATMERTQRTVARRAADTAQLQRTQMVLQRAFGSILVSAPAPQRPASVAVAQPAGQDGTSAPGGGSATTTAASNTPSVSREVPAESRGRRAPGEAPDRGPGARRESGPAGSTAPATGAGTGSGAQPPTTTTPSASQPLVRPPEDAPPRVILHHDDLVSRFFMTLKETDGTVSRIAPQRLEMVLIEPPVPTQQPDPFVLAQQVRLEAKRRGIAHERPDQSDQAPDTAGQEPDAASNPDAAASEDWGIRAVRGAFELLPKEDQSGQALLGEDGNPKAWELWWVPLAPRMTIEEVREMGRARAVLEASSYGQPFRVATDLTACRFRMFSDRTRKEEYQATIQNELPAYAEVDVATVAGVSATWLFEVSWATGPETRPRTDDGTTPQDVSGAAGGARGAGGQGKGSVGKPGGGTANPAGGMKAGDPM